MLVEVGSILEGTVSGITNFGAFVKLPDGTTGLVHISEVAEEYVKDIKTHLNENQAVKVKVLSIDNKGKISLSIKKAMESTKPPVKHSSRSGRSDGDRNRNNYVPEPSFEDRLARFMKDSDEKMHDLKKNVESKRGSGSSRR